MPKITLDWNTLYNFVTDAFVAVGVPRNDAVICTDVLLESDKRGIESHGVNRFKPIYIDRILDKIQKPVTEFEILRETPTTAVVDGHDGMGQVVGYKAMSMAIEKAKKYGMGMVAARNSCHYGIAGYYATMATKANMIGITGTNARPSIAPTFGVENMLGTNPLTIGLPTDEANAVLQTRDGYLWVGSYGGLLRFDGSEFHNFSTEGAIATPSIRCLFEDSAGRL